jgi:hypothetical protein
MMARFSVNETKWKWRPEENPTAVSVQRAHKLPNPDAFAPERLALINRFFLNVDFSKEDAISGFPRYLSQLEAQRTYRICCIRLVTVLQQRITSQPSRP